MLFHRVFQLRCTFDQCHGLVAITLSVRNLPGQEQPVNLDVVGETAFARGRGSVRLPVWAEVRGLNDGSRIPDSRVLVAQMQLTDGAGQTLFVNPLVVFGFNPQPEPPP